MNKFFMFIIICLISANAFAFETQAETHLAGKKQKRQEQKTYKYELSACLMFQDEARFLKEWIEYHKLVGVQHFYLFDNASKDNYLEILQPYISSGEVELYHYPTVTNSQPEYLAVQCAIYNHAVSLAADATKWLAIIDADEFLVPLNDNSLIPILNKYERSKVGGLYVNWLCFGTSWVEKIPEDHLMIEMLNRCGNVSNLGKSIVRADRVSGCSDPHRMWYHSPFYHVNTNFQKFDWICPIADDKLLIFHYYTGDVYNLVNVKFPRRQKWIGIELASYIESLEGLNAKQNDTMQRFVQKLRKNMKSPVLTTAIY